MATVAILPFPSAAVSVFETPAEVAAAAAHAVASSAASAVAARKRFLLALSGGSTPKAVYSLLGADPAIVPWDKTEIFFGDERCVPSDHADSNYRMVRETLIGRIPQATVHRVETELGPDEAAARYDTALREAGDGGIPRFDLILLGMGADGHTASLFPGTSALAENRRLAVANFVPQLGADRVTFTFPVINAAQRVLFLASGADKSAMLAEVLAGPRSRYPAQNVYPHGVLEWYVDRAAAAALAAPR